MWHTPWFVLFFKKDSNSAVAYVASKKVGNAVKRNRAKRRLRALFREKEELYHSGVYILVAKAPILTVEFSNLKDEWDKTLRKSRLLQDSSDILQRK